MLRKCLVIAGGNKDHLVMVEMEPIL